MKALALGKHEVDAALEPGRYYNIEPAEAGTDAQNKAFHALVQEYFKSGAFSYPAKTARELKDQIKLRLGAGVEEYVYVTEDGRKARSKTPPERCAADRTGAPLSWAKLKSWADYSKRERRETLDALVAEMLAAGTNSPKFEEILRGMEGFRK